MLTGINRKLLCCWALIGSLIAPQALAESAAQQWLGRMNDAVRQLNYEGTFVYLHDGQLEAMHLIHVMHPDTGEHERLLSLNGAAREVVRDDHGVACIWPDTGSVFVESRNGELGFPVILPRDLGKLHSHYEYLALGPDRVAGKNAQQILIHPRDAYRYGYRLWIDEASGLPLKSDLLDETGEAIEQIMFTSLSVFEEINPEHLRHMDVPDIAETPQHNDISGKSRWSTDLMPEGFLMTAHGMRPEENGHVVEHMVFSDGLASFSVYIEPTVGETLNGASRMGSISAFGMRKGEYQITVVGEVPEATVRQVAESMSMLRDEP